MVIMPNGSLGFDNIYDMYYDLFNEIGLSLNAQTNILYDQDTGNPLMLKDKYIKASIDGRPVYPGKNDIIFEPDKNYPLIKSLYLFYVDKCINSEDGDTLGYIADYIDDDEAKEKQRVVIKTKLKGEIYSNFYWQIYLAYIDNIFRIAGYNIDLSNFDVKPEK
jgi:hypothetical protein